MIADNLVKRRSLVTTHCADSDIERTYPTVQIVINGGKSTTIRELVQVDNYTYDDERENGFNLIGGCVNSMRFCSKTFGLPLQDDLLDIFNSQQ